MTNSTASASAWNAALLAAKCAEMDLALFWQGPVADGAVVSQVKPTQYPVSLVLEIDNQAKRSFDIPQDLTYGQSTFANQTRVQYSLNIALALAPSLTFEEGSLHSTKVSLYGDSLQQEQLSTGVLDQTLFTQCNGAASSSSGDATNQGTTISQSSAAPTGVTAQVAAQQQHAHDHTVRAGIAAGVLGFALLCLVTAILVRRKHLIRKQQMDQRKRRSTLINHRWVETSEV